MVRPLSSELHLDAPPWWLPGGHLQTIWPALFSRSHLDGPPRYSRERWPTPDGDFIDVDHLLPAPGAAPADPQAPLLVLFHGLESSSTSRYALAFADVAGSLGWRFCVPHFRGCSGELNHAPRAYHSGDFEEIGWVLSRLHRLQAQSGGAPLLAVGVSLGGNALLRWAAEAGDGAARLARAVAAVSAPVDLAAAGRAIDSGVNRLLYGRMFLRSMKPKALAKWQQHPGTFDRERVAAARTLYAFDDAFTAPLHGFRDTPDYWARASAKPHLHRIRVPALLLNARNDPFVPQASLPRAGQAGAHVTLWQPAGGGHVGFTAGAFPGHVLAMPRAVCAWLRAACGNGAGEAGARKPADPAGPIGASA